jgi:hypothetical protein
MPQRGAITLTIDEENSAADHDEDHEYLSVVDHKVRNK